METLNELFFFELELLSEKKNLAQITLTRRLEISNVDIAAIRNNEYPEERVAYFYEKVLTENLLCDVMERFKVACDYVAREYHFKGYNFLMRRLDISSWRFRHIMNGDRKFFTEEFLRAFNTSYSEIFNLDWIIYGEGLMFRDDYHLLKNYDLHSRRAAAEAGERATRAHQSTHDYDSYYDIFHRKLLVKKALNPDYARTTYENLTQCYTDIQMRESEIDRLERTIEACEREIEKHKVRIERNRERVEHFKNLRIGFAFSEFLEDIERL